MSKMGFLHQLRLLLWKNFTLKKRNPFRVAFEILIPLVLFLILMVIRLHRIPYKSTEGVFSAKALPSAGIIPLLQSFCPNVNSQINQDGFPDFPNASIGKILEDIAYIYNNPSIKGLWDLSSLKDDMNGLVTNPSFPPEADRKFGNMTLKKFFLNPSEIESFMVKNMSLPLSVVRGLMHSKINSDEASKILLEKRKDILQEYFLYINPRKYPAKFKSLQRSVTAQALFDPLSISNGPTWLNALSVFSGLTNSLDLERDKTGKRSLLNKVFKDQFLGPNEIKLISCNRDEFLKLFQSAELSQAQMMSTQKHLCNLSALQMEWLSQEMKQNLNWSAVLEQMHSGKTSLNEYKNQVLRIQKDLNTIAEIESVIRKSSDIAKKFHFNMTVMEKNNASEHRRMFHYASEIWRVVDPIICGPRKKGNSKDDADSTIKRLFRSRDQSIRALKFMLYMLTNNPKILYAPNTTDVNNVMAKAGHFLHLLKMTKTYAATWLNISRDLKVKLMNEKTQSYLRKIYDASEKFPFLFTDWSANLTNYVNRNISVVDEKISILNNTIMKYINQTHFHLKRTVTDLLKNKYERIPILKKTLFIDNVARAWIVFLKPFKLDIFFGFRNESQLMEYVFNVTASRELKRHVLSAILFDNVDKNGTLPKHVVYRIRMDGRLGTTTAKIRSRYWYPGPRHYHMPYLYYGFIWLQDSLERAIMEVMVGRNITSPGIYIHEMPYPCFLKDRFMFVIQYVMPLCMTVSFIYSVALLVQSIVYEKEQRLKEVMKMMGLSNAVHWTAWFITSMITLGLNVMLLTIILKVGGILQYSDPGVTWLFLSLSAIATTLFCFLISVFFSKAKLAAACGGIIYFLTYMPYVFISIREGGSHVKISAAWKSFSSLFSTTAFGLGARYFALFEQNGEGLQWHNIATSPLLEDDFNLAQVFAMLIVDTFIYGILAWYIEAVHPGAYGLPRPWYFPFQWSYWCGQDLKNCTRKKTFDGLYHRMHSINDDNASLETPGLLASEKEPVHLPLGVVIKNLVKVYKLGKKTAVDNLSLNLYEGQITSFLGHNGAGKTTTMSILTGLFPPTSGTAFIYGNDIRNDMDKIRTSLGMCPQHNVLFDRMTVEEHLWFYARLKGMASSEVKAEMDRILEDIGLPTKRHSLVDTLSGGMQRKLSVAMAFVGGSRTVILDEPTAGVDPYARRAIWDLLVKYKQGRTILLSTHFMDEADILGDRIAIISHGKLRCCGSSLFLKSQFGDGYHLTLVKNTRGESRSGVHRSPSPRSSPYKGQTSVSTSEIKKYMATFVPSCQLICETQHELSFILPDKDLKRGMLRKLFYNLEKDKEKLGSQSFGLTDTTLEEVFLKVTEAASRDEDSEDNDLICDVALPHMSPTKDVAMSVEPSTDGACKLDMTEDTQQNGLQISSASASESRTTKGHRRSWSSDFLKEKTCTSPVANTVCAHRRTPSGGYCGHRRALSSDYHIDRKMKVPETFHASTSEGVRRGHQRTPSNTSCISQNSAIVDFDDIKVSIVNNATLRWKQFYGLLIKRLHHGRRNFKGVISQIFLPAIFICIAMTVALSRQGYETSLPRLILSPSMFRPPPNYIPVNNEYQTSVRYANKIEETLTLPSGVGADCVLRNTNSTWFHTFRFKTSKATLLRKFDNLCAQQVSDSYDVVFDVSKDIYEGGNGTMNVSSRGTESQFGPHCRCSKDFRSYICDAGVEGNPQSYTTVTRDTLLNLTGRNMEEYLKFTTFRFKRHRYGALSLGLNRDIVPEKLEQISNDDIKRLFVKHVAKAWFNNKGYHSMPAYLNVINNAILRANINRKVKGNPAAYGITAINHPFNVSGNVLNEESMRQGTDVVIAIFVIIAMSFVPASFVVFLVMERATKAKHLQFVSGVDPTIYWLSNYTWDMLNYMIPASACMMILYFFQVPAYSSPTNFPATCWLFVLYGWSITPLMYPAAFLFREASTAYVVLIVLNLFVGITCTVTTFILQMFPDDPPLVTAYNTVKMLSLAFPNYCLGRGLMDLAFNEYINEYYRLVGEFGNVRSPFEWELVTRSLVAMFSEGLAFFLLTLLIEYQCNRKSRHKQADNSAVGEEDEDVAFERQRVLNGETEDNALLIESLSKVYRSRKTGKQLAVDKLCLAVARGECFGLLGVNGAGKTTTFKMLTGDTSITSGIAFVKKYSVITDAAKVRKRIGYCPQFDALIDELTGREHLSFYARLRGVPEQKVSEVVNGSLKRFALSRYADRPSKTYSGGNKRKLSAAIALLGNPAVVFMDEPTTGMDPGSRRFLWNVILNIVQEGTRSVVLTSHSMEECEALCTRLAIMVNGRFKCIGSTQHLKNKFGEGYIVTVRVKGDVPNLEPVKCFFQEKLPDAILKECHHNMLQYQVPSSGQLGLADLFGHMEEAQENLNVEDYSVSQTTLDNVFINFAKQQMDCSSEQQASLSNSSLGQPKAFSVLRDWLTLTFRRLKNTSSPSRGVRFSKLSGSDENSWRDECTEDSVTSVATEFSGNRSVLSFHESSTGV